MSEAEGGEDDCVRKLQKFKTLLFWGKRQKNTIAFGIRTKLLLPVQTAKRGIIIAESDVILLETK